jgi:hypothetical protein
MLWYLSHSLNSLAAGTHNNDVLVYVADADQWLTLDKTDATPVPRGWHACCTTAKGDVALFGGLSNQNERLADFYIFG